MDETSPRNDDEGVDSLHRGGETKELAKHLLPSEGGRIFSKFFVASP